MVRLLIIFLLATGLQAQVFNFQDQPFLAQSGVKLTDNLVAAWHLDEQVANGNRVDAVSGITWYDVGGVGSLRGVVGGAASITNTGTQYLSVTNSQFQGTGGFTLAFWVFGGNSTSAFMGQKKGDASASDWFVDAGPTFTVFDSGNTGHSISPTLVAGQWNFIVVGFDGSSQIFVTANAGAKTTIACTSVRATANMPFVNRWAEGGVDEVQFWSRALTSAEITQVYNSGFGLPYPFTVSDKGVLAESSYGWAVTNAGVTLGNTSSNALVGFIDGCVSDGVWSSVSYCLPFVSDNLTAALLPLVTTPALSGGNAFAYWIYPVNHNFVSGDLTINGLTGNASNKYLDTGLSPSSFATSASAGFSWYAYTTTAGGGIDYGSFDGGFTTGLEGFSKFSDNNSYAYSGAAANQIMVASPGPGFYSDNRTSSTVHKLYFANSSSSPAQIGATDSTAFSAAQNAVSIAIFARNSAGTVSLFSNDTLSVVVGHNGLSSAEFALLYNRVQAYRVVLGGGFR